MFLRVRELCGAGRRDESGGIGESLDCLLQCSDGRAAPFTSFGSVDPERDRALELRSTPTKGIQGPHRHEAPDDAGPSMLNSARRYCTSVRLHFRPRRFCRRCACDASYDSVANAGSIAVTTTDKPLRIDSV
jgi:hypothetical protein